MALRIRVDKTPTENDVFQRNVPDLTKQTSVRDSAMNAMLINTGKQIIMQSTNKIANHIGKSYEMRKANEMLSLFGDVATIATQGAVGVIAVGAKYALQAVDMVLQQQASEREQALAWRRSGNSVLGRQ